MIENIPWQETLSAMFFGDGSCMPAYFLGPGSGAVGIARLRRPHRLGGAAVASGDHALAVRPTADPSAPVGPLWSANALNGLACAVIVRLRLTTNLTTGRRRLCRFGILGWPLGVAAGLFAFCGNALAQAAMGREHMLPLFLSTSEVANPPSATGVRQEGFMRIINHSDKEARVEISGYDDAGEARGPVTLMLDAKQTRHLNSADVENGNADKNLSSGLGAPSMGNWRLHLKSEQDIEPLAYIRTRPDGFLTSMSAIAPSGAMRHRVSIFNPASNFNQRSWLRLVNLSADAANVTISGVDDAGVAAPGGAVSLSLLGGQARTVTAEALETGAGDLRRQLRREGSQRQVATDGHVQPAHRGHEPAGHPHRATCPISPPPRPTTLARPNFWKLSFEDGVTQDGLSHRDAGQPHLWLAAGKRPDKDRRRHLRLGRWQS